MAVVNSITEKDYLNDKQILIAPELAFTVGCLVTNTGVIADEDGKKILKAGTPVGGAEDVLLNRKTVLAQDTSTTAQGVLLHDVDVTNGQGNATLVVEGVVDINKVDESVKTLLTTAKDNLAKITLMDGYKG